MSRSGPRLRLNLGQATAIAAEVGPIPRSPPPAAPAAGVAPGEALRAGQGPPPGISGTPPGRGAQPPAQRPPPQAPPVQAPHDQSAAAPASQAAAPTPQTGAPDAARPQSRAPQAPSAPSAPWPDGPFPETPLPEAPPGLSELPAASFEHARAVLDDVLPPRARPAPPGHVPEGLGQILLRRGLLTESALADARAEARATGARLERVLHGRGLVPEADLLTALALGRGAPLLQGLSDLDPDPALARRLGPEVCRRFGVFPLGGAGPRPLLATAWPDNLAALRRHLGPGGPPLGLALAPDAAVRRALRDAWGGQYLQSAETGLAPAASARGLFRRRTDLPPAFLPLALALLTLAALMAPVASLAVVTGWAVLTLALTAGLKAAALVAALRRGPATLPPPDPDPARWPVITLLVPLFKETEIAAHLLEHLRRLDYPRGRLEVLFVAEAIDMETRATLDRTRLPPWARVVSVPPGTLQTKPRALNYALGAARGEILGIYDAEDRPDPDQLRRVAARFANRPPRVACLQGALDFYNPRDSLVSRGFTLDYAGWFRVLLPGFAALGLALPLGGTTVFLRREALQTTGAWDAHNVTEDADLGLRLARHGFTTEMLPTTTREEATHRPLPWIRQRSRWLKGYLITWMVHMRAPRLALRQLGPRAFWGMQVHFLGGLSQVICAPFLWLFWLHAAGGAHPAAPLLPGGALPWLIALFVGAEALNAAIALIGLQRSGHRRLGWMILLMPLYHAMGHAAALKALWEMVHRPFHWDKTAHGHSRRSRPGRRGLRALRARLRFRGNRASGG